jgi:prophage tail gpP-like protein
MTDAVTIKLAGRSLFRVTDYDLKLGIFEQPGTFACTIGRPYPFRWLAEAFPPKTPYQVFLGDTLVQTGLTDGFSLAGSDKTQSKLASRSVLARVVDDEVPAELSFRNPTYRSMVDEVLERSGVYTLLERFGITSDVLLTSNEGNRVVWTGTQRARGPKTAEVIETAAGGGVYEYVRAEVGTKWGAFLFEKLRRAGLFLWEAADGKIVLASPNVDQPPIGRLERTEGRNDILGESFSNDTTGRHSECTVYGRNQGGKDGTGKLEGRYVDEEMVAFLNPNEADRANGGVIKLALTKRDREVKTQRQAVALARREIAEERRRGWRLSYTIQGHTLPGIGPSDRVRPAPDSIIEVHDDYLGIYGPMLIESARFMGTEGTTTTQLDLLRVEDCFFLIPPPPRKKLAAKGPNVDPVNTRVFINRIATLQSRFVPEYATGGFSWPDPFENLAPRPDET